MSQPAVTAPTCDGVERARFRRAVAAHFRGRIDAREEGALRAHLPTCPACRRFYGRALALSSADPHAVPARDRLARGLGLRGARRPAAASAARRWAWAIPALAVVALVAVRVGLPARNAPAGDGPGAGAPPVSRGPATSAPALLAYRIPARGTPIAVGRSIDGHDELAFAYANPGGWPYLMVFAVDEHTHVYWYHPAWRVGATPPVAVSAQPGPGPFELPSATRHVFDGRRLLVYAVFARRQVSVEEIERAARAGARPGDLPLSGDLQIVRLPLEVTP